MEGLTVISQSISESLPYLFNHSMGYHSHCYKNFTAIQKPKKISLRIAAKLKLGNYKFGDGPDFVAQEIQYHHQCKRIYLHQKEEITSENQSYRRKCILFILEFVESKVIPGEKPILASFLLERYKITTLI